MIKDVEQLVGLTGDLAVMAGLPRDADGWRNAGRLSWTGRGVALTNLTADRIRLEDTIVNPRFVSCKLRRSLFKKLKTDGGLFGAQDNWTECEFDDVWAVQPIMAQSRFVKCVFRRGQFDALHPYDTVFDGCEFHDVKVFGLKCLPISRPPTNPEFHILGESVLFRNCRFVRPSFTGCNFQNVWFEESTVTDAVFDDCDFSGIKSDVQWWGGAPNVDPFVSFLREAIDMAVANLGPACRAGAVMSKFLHDYQHGNVEKMGYANCLYDGTVPDYELDRIEHDLTALERKFSL